MRKVFAIISSLFTYLKEVRVELKRVNWPSRQIVVRYTAVVVVSSLAVGIFLGTLDIVFQRGLSLLTRFSVPSQEQPQGTVPAGQEQGQVAIPVELGSQDGGVPPQEEGSSPNGQPSPQP